VTSGWIIGENLRPFAEMLSWQVGYSFSDDDWAAIAAQLDATDEAQERRTEYEIRGDETVRLRYALMDRENEGTYVSVHVSGPPNAEAAAATAINLMQAYFLRVDQ
jgi:hypothetical protein